MSSNTTREVSETCMPEGGWLTSWAIDDALLRDSASMWGLLK